MTAMCLDKFKGSVLKIAIEVDNTNSQVLALDVSTTFSEAILVVGGFWIGYGLSEKNNELHEQKT